MKKAFTLIELLVVIAIIAILAALLMPALGRARKEAQKTACRNNVHQVGISFNLFTNDHGGIFPGWVGDTVNSDAYYTTIKNAVSTAGDPYYQLIKQGYCEDVNLFDCPSADNPAWGDWVGPTVQGADGDDNHNNDSKMPDGSWSGFPEKTVSWPEYSYDVGRVSKNSAPGRIYYGDAQERVHGWAPLYWNFNHPDGSNALFIDLAVDFAKVEYPDEQWAAPCGWGDWTRHGWIPNPRMDEDSYRLTDYQKIDASCTEAKLTEPQDHDDIYVVEGFSSWGAVWTGQPWTWGWPPAWSMVGNPNDLTGNGGTAESWNNDALDPEPWGAGQHARSCIHYWNSRGANENPDGSWPPCMTEFPEIGQFANEGRWETHDCRLMLMIPYLYPPDNTSVIP